MEPCTEAPHVLVVASNPAATAALAEAVRERRAAGPATFTVLVPNPEDQLVFDRVSQDVHVGEHRLADVLPMLEDTLGLEIDGRAAPSPCAYDDVLEELDARSYDEIIVPASPRRQPHPPHPDLGERIAELGYAVTIVAERSGRTAVAAG
jgi:hypothetical protein